MEDGDEKNELIQLIANLMKKSYLTWNRDSVDDSLIISDLKNLSKGKLTVPDDFRLTQTNEILANTATKKRPTNQHKNKKHYQKKRRY